MTPRFCRTSFALLLLVALICGPWAARAQDAAMALEAPRAPVVTVTRVEQHEMIGQVPIAGTLVARDEVLIYPQVSGFPIDEIYVEIGDTVRKGDLLARLNSRTLEAQLAQAEAEYSSAEAAVSQANSQINSAEATLTQAQSALTRAQQLRSSGSGTQANLDQAIAAEQTASANLASARDGLALAGAQVQQAAAQRDIARLNLDHATILAPVDGLISARTARVGAIAASGGAPLFTLIAGGIIEVEAEVVETAMSSLQLGDAVDLKISGIGPVAGQIRLISPVVDPVTRLGAVRITTEPHPALRTGLFASGWITTERRVALTVPVSAVLTDATGQYVLRVDDNTVEKRPVTADLIWQDRREVTAGLSLGDVVMAEAGAFFADGDTVRPVFSGGGAAPEAVAEQTK